MGHDDRFRKANRYAGTQGFVGGFSNFHEADYGRGVVHGTFMLSGTAVEWRDIPRATLSALDAGAHQIDNVPAVVRAVSRWGSANGFDGGIPTFEQGIAGGTVVYGAMLLRAGVTQWRDVPRGRLGANSPDDVPNLMRGASDYAAANGFAAGFPTFEQADHGAGVVFGIHLFPAGAITWKDVYADILKMQWDYTFDSGFTEAEATTIMERWAHAYERLMECGSVSAGDRSRIVTALRKNINHTLNAAANANASAPLNGSTVNINRGNFFGLIAREQAQTLLHEICHSAGFGHPDRRDCPPGVPPACDTPGDNGQYYGTVPLQAELCIAGVQSDVVCAEGPSGMSCARAPTPRVIGIDYNPPGSDVDREQVRITHDGAAPVQLQGWTLRDVANHTYTFPTFTLPPGEVVSVWTGTGTNDPNNLFWGRRQAVWNNRGDTATLADPTGAIRHVFSYR
ncbi:lamin tail domain-containing protein [Amaricoccus sp.]|uniref:lamin tail domain-containing protein n=1 Tax=Amaricoccus sp. TaxID=1872485 RepID=UPI001B5D9671|nr:lamin tail domain-containing protein [Amaricoccus sp.]MBP7241811.1 lamin tail domain-containing protein [Amaricoccus sp.]